MEPYHELLGLIALRQKNYKQAVTELRQADQTQLHNKYQLAQALEATKADGRGASSSTRRWRSTTSTRWTSRCCAARR